MKDFTRHPLLVRKNTQATEKRRFEPKLLALIPVVLVIIFGWPLIVDFDAHFSKFLQNIPTESPTATEVTTIDSRGASFEDGKVRQAPDTAPVSTEKLKTEIEALVIDGVTVEQINQDDRGLTITGFAEDNRQIASYYKLLRDEVSKPELEFVQRGRRQEKAVSEFSIRMNDI